MNIQLRMSKFAITILTTFFFEGLFVELKAADILNSKPVMYEFFCGLLKRDVSNPDSLFTQFNFNLGNMRQINPGFDLNSLDSREA